MVTGMITVNTSITKTSSLFMINRIVPGMGPGESSWEGTLYGWLTVVPWQVLGQRNIGGATKNGIPGMMHSMSSHCICHLPEV